MWEEGRSKDFLISPTTQEQEPGGSSTIPQLFLHVLPKNLFYRKTASPLISFTFPLATSSMARGKTSHSFSFTRSCKLSSVSPGSTGTAS